MFKQARELRQQGKSTALVPTMGFLHDGHLSLVRKGRQLADDLVVSIFVNPKQFAPHEDLVSYPRDLDRDLELLSQEGVDTVFTPTEAQFYPENYETYVSLESLPHHLCGLSRPIFFRGVATVVTKLFNLVQPQYAVFGEKDYQQLTIIRRMTVDLNFDIQIVAGPTIRDADGLALSSRNAYLKADQRPAALSLYHALTQAQDQLDAGCRDSATLLEQARKIIEGYTENRIDYIAIVDPVDLASVRTIDQPVRMALAVEVAGVRLIDNMELTP